jgi:hypothetical protein
VLAKLEFARLTTFRFIPSVILLAMSFLAASIPARKAAGIDPMVARRYE